MLSMLCPPDGTGHAGRGSSILASVMFKYSAGVAHRASSVGFIFSRHQIRSVSILQVQSSGFSLMEICKSPSCNMSRNGSSTVLIMLSAMSKVTKLCSTAMPDTVVMWFEESYSSFRAPNPSKAPDSMTSMRLYRRSRRLSSPKPENTPLTSLTIRFLFR